MTNISVEDLRDTGRLLELHRQAVERGDPVAGEAGRLDFIALAERARASGKNPPKLFAWLLKHRRFDFIAQANEDDAAARLREFHFGEDKGQRQAEDPGQSPRPSSGGGEELTEDEKFVAGCLKIGRLHKVDPFRIARSKGWDRERWELARESFERKDRQRW